MKKIEVPLFWKDGYKDLATAMNKIMEEDEEEIVPLTSFFSYLGTRGWLLERTGNNIYSLQIRHVDAIIKEVDELRMEREKLHSRIKEIDEKLKDTP